MGIVEYVLGMGRSFYRGAGLVPEFSYVGAGSGLADELRDSQDGLDIPTYNLMGSKGPKNSRNTNLHRQRETICVSITEGTFEVIPIRDLPKSRTEQIKYLMVRGASKREAKKQLKYYDQQVSRRIRS